jgi:hypothetical protein
MKLPRSLSDGELRDYADHHLKYEIEMLVWASGIMATLGTFREEGPLAWACNNALLNTFALHSRNLIDFLYLGASDKGRATDVIVQDYVDQKTLSKYLPPITPLLQQAKKKADKQAAHLTTDRIQYAKSGKGWKFIEIAKDIMKAFRAIAPVLPENRVSDPLKRRISQSDLFIPQVAINVTRSVEGWPIGITFCGNLEKVDQNWKVKCHKVSA